MKLIKFKYIAFRVEQDNNDLKEDFKVVTCPINTLHYLPDGEYLIRGHKRYFRKKYYFNQNTWFLVSDHTFDNGQYYCDSTEYMLFPTLTEKCWENIEKTGFKKLNKIWQRHLCGYLHWKSLMLLQKKSRLWLLH